MLHSKSLADRLSATVAHSVPKDPSEFYPEGLRGAANAYTVFVGPSYGGYNGTGEKLAGGLDRPISSWSKRVVGGGLGLNPFPDGRADRQNRWNRLLLACLDSSDAVSRLSALYNLDWGHYPDEKAVSPVALESGAGVVVEYIICARPRFIIPLSRLVWRYLIPALMSAGGEVLSDGVLPSHQSMLIRLPDDAGGFFEAIAARPFNHPSRHFLTNARIEAFRGELAPYKTG